MHTIHLFVHLLVCLTYIAICIKIKLQIIEYTIAKNEIRQLDMWLGMALNTYTAPPD